jgi:ABC-2 type transport system permease protein
VGLALLAVWMLADRDIGLGMLPHRDSRKPRRFLLGAPWRAALRDETPQLAIWFAGALFYALLLGGLAKSVLDFFRSNSTLSGLLGTDLGLSIYLTLAFSIVQLIVVLLGVTLVVSARTEEASGRLELLLAGPLSRIGWLLSRTLLATGVALALALLCAVALWGGATLAGQDVMLGPILEAGLNSLPLIVIFAGGAAVVLALAPRAVAFVYVPVAVAYLWEAIGGALKMPAWALDISPFHALAAVPRDDFAILPAAILAVIGVAFMVVAAAEFRGRDLVTG